MTKQFQDALDLVCAELRELAQAHEVERIELMVRQDGRVHFHGMRRSITAGAADADVHPEALRDGEPLPSAAVEALARQFAGRRFP